MRVIYAFVALTAVASGLPANTKWGPVKAHPTVSNSEVLEYIHDLFEKTCHNLCLKRFPEEGPAQDKCMSICHREHPDSSHENMDEDMDGM